MLMDLSEQGARNRRVPPGGGGPRQLEQGRRVFPDQIRRIWRCLGLNERLGPSFGDEQRRDAVADLVFAARLEMVESNAVDTQWYRFLNDSKTHPAEKSLRWADSSK